MKVSNNVEFGYRDPNFFMRSGSQLLLTYFAPTFYKHNSSLGLRATFSTKASPVTFICNFYLLSQLRWWMSKILGWMHPSWWYPVFEQTLIISVFFGCFITERTPTKFKNILKKLSRNYLYFLIVLVLVGIFGGVAPSLGFANDFIEAFCFSEFSSVNWESTVYITHMNHQVYGVS